MKDRMILINNSFWNIHFIPRLDMLHKLEEEGCKEEEGNYTQGITIYSKQVIYIDSTVADPRKILIHELTHAWLYAFGHNQGNKQFDHEDVCEIVSLIHHFIDHVLEEVEE